MPDLPLYPGATTGTVRYDGFTAGWTDAGVAVPGRLPVVLVHGTGGTVESHFHTVFPMLASRGRTIGVDLDCGGPGDRLDLADLVGQVGAVVDHLLGEADCCLLGYSLGSCVATAAAARRPDQVPQLVLLNGWARTDNAMRLRFELWQRLHDEGNDAALAELMLLNVYGRSYLNAIPYVGPRPFAQVEQMREAYVVGPGSERQVELNRTMDVTGDVLAVQAQTLVIGSAGDQLVPLEHSQELFGAVERASLAVVPGGHGSVTERPAHVFQLVDRFLREPAAFPAGAVVTDDLVVQLEAVDLAAADGPAATIEMEASA